MDSQSLCSSLLIHLESRAARPKMNPRGYVVDHLLGTSTRCSTVESLHGRLLDLLRIRRTGYHLQSKLTKHSKALCSLHLPYCQRLARLLEHQ